MGAAAAAISGGACETSAAGAASCAELFVSAGRTGGRQCERTGASAGALPPCAWLEARPARCLTRFESTGKQPHSGPRGAVFRVR